MKHFIINCLVLLTVGCTILCTSCKKDWLDAKPEKSLVNPSTIEDYQALLDNSGGENIGSATNAKANILDELATGDLYLTNDIYNSASIFERNLYRWADTIYD